MYHVQKLLLHEYVVLLLVPLRARPTHVQRETQIQRRVLDQKKKASQKIRQIKLKDG